MKASLVFILLTLAVNAFALPVGTYEGTNNGQGCDIEISNPTSDGWAYVSTHGEFDCHYASHKEKSNKILLKGWNDIGYCKTEVSLDSNGVPTEYKLKERLMISPIYLSKGTCKNLIKKD